MLFNKSCSLNVHTYHQQPEFDHDRMDFTMFRVGMNTYNHRPVRTMLSGRRQALQDTNGGIRRLPSSRYG